MISSRRSRPFRRSVLALLVGALALAGCGTSNEDATAEVEQTLTEELAQSAPGGPLSPDELSVECPEVEAGEAQEFECTLTIPSGEELPVAATINDDGRLDAQVQP